MRYSRIRARSDGRRASRVAVRAGRAWLLASLLGLAIGGAVRADGDSDDDGKLLSVDQVRASLEAIKSKNGTLTIADFLGVMRPSDRSAVQVKDLGDSYLAFVALLSPAVKKDDVI